MMLSLALYFALVSVWVSQVQGSDAVTNSGANVERSPLTNPNGAGNGFIHDPYSASVLSALLCDLRADSQCHSHLAAVGSDIVAGLLSPDATDARLDAATDELPSASNRLPTTLYASCQWPFVANKQKALCKWAKRVGFSGIEVAECESGDCPPVFEISAEEGFDLVRAKADSRSLPEEKRLFAVHSSKQKVLDWLKHVRVRVQPNRENFFRGCELTRRFAKLVGSEVVDHCDKCEDGVLEMDFRFDTLQHARDFRQFVHEKLPKDHIRANFIPFADDLLDKAAENRPLLE